MFQSGAELTAAQDADDRIIYNSTDGSLYCDGDGTGATLFTVLDGAPAITAGNFFIAA